MKQSLHIIVKGRVQGVCFRAATQKQAIKLNVSGFARNLADGNVEIVAKGDAEALRILVSWCHKGPMLAKVTEVVVNPYPVESEFIDFEVR